MMSASSEQRKLAAIMFTDMVGYSALSQRDDQLALELLEEHRQLLREIFPRFNGTEIKTIGDAFLVEFSSALEAAQCAIEVQRMLAKRDADAPAERQIRVRIGIHIGDVVHRGGDVYGDGVNIASRIEQLAAAGGICVSMDVQRQIRDALKARFEKLAPTELKNISVPMDLFRIVLPWEAAAVAERFEIPARSASHSDAGGENRKAEIGEKDHSFSIRAFAIVGIFVVIVIALGWWWTTRPHSTSMPRQSASEARTEAATAIPEKSIAVLSFDSLSEDKGNAYFAEGIQDEILTKLATIADLKVISRTSTAKYASKPEDLKTVSQQLGVANVLEGSVQRAGEKVRVNVQLIDARADAHLWAKSYDGDAKDIFAVETEVSQQVADALQAKLSPVEAKTIATAPTKDAAAYDLFLKAESEFRSALSSLRPESFQQAIEWYRQAYAQDPAFALAMARLAECELNVHWFLDPLDDAHLAAIKTTIDHAVGLAPDLAETHVALGLFHYFGHRAYPEAAAEFRRAIELQPNNSTALQYLGWVHRRQGQWQRALNELNKTLEQDPRNSALTGNLANTYNFLRNYQEAIRLAKRALSVDPHEVVGMVAWINAILQGSGDADEAQRVLATFPPDTKLTTNSTVPEFVLLIGYRSWVLEFARKFDSAVHVWDNSSDERRQLASRVAIHLVANDTGAARTDAEKARPLLEQRLEQRPEDTAAMTALSWVYLGLGRRADAVEIARRASETLPLAKDAVAGGGLRVGLAEIEVHAGMLQEGIAVLREQLSAPVSGGVSVAQLQHDPLWDPIRNDPEFQQLLTIKEHVGP